MAPIGFLHSHLNFQGTTAVSFGSLSVVAHTQRDDLEKAERLNPSFHQSPLHLSWAYRLAGRYEDAFKQAKKGVDRNPNYLLTHLALTATCSLTGREAEACAAAVEVLRITPRFSVEQYRKDLYALFKDKSQIDFTIDAFHKAGLK